MNIPIIPSPEVKLAALKEYEITQNSSDLIAKKIYEQICDFEKRLDSESEIGMRILSFGQVYTFYIKEIGFVKPNLLIFKGHTDQNENIELIQHYTQLSFLLINLKKISTEIKKNPIGFVQY